VRDSAQLESELMAAFSTLVRPFSHKAVEKQLEGPAFPAPQPVAAASWANWGHTDTSIECAVGMKKMQEEGPKRPGPV
jgi:hypothetical protein